MKVGLVTFIDLADAAPHGTAMESGTTNYLKCKEPAALLKWIKAISLPDLLERTRDMQIRLSRVIPGAPVASSSIPKVIL